jgi:hypothetical protein
MPARAAAAGLLTFAAPVKTGAAVPAGELATDSTELELAGAGEEAGTEVAGACG